MRLVAQSFAERSKGPDRVHGFRADMLLETWTYAWSPAVEASLIERSADGETVREVATTMLIRRLRDLEKDGQSNNAEAAFSLLSIAFDAGIGEADVLIAAVGAAAREDGNLLRLANALLIGHGLNGRAKAVQSDSTAQSFASLLPPLLDQLARSIAERLGDLAAIHADNVGEAIRCLAAIAEAMADPDPPFPTEPLRAALSDLMAVHPLDSELFGAVIALAALIGLIDDAEAGRRLSAALAGAFERPGDAIRTLSGVMALAPQLFINDSSVIAAIDKLFGSVDDPGFLALLPQLRMAFAELSPQETDRVAAIVAAAHGAGEDDLAALREVPDARVLSEHLVLGERLRNQWLEDGLAAWLEAAP
jgi:hypothetical protein